jgi:hypothetical protein
MNAMGGGMSQATPPRYSPTLPDRECGEAETTTITPSATPKGNGYQATVTFSDGVSISSAETYPTIAEAITAAALKLLDMPERLERLDRSEIPIQA